MALSVYSTVLNTRDLQRSYAFWSELLGARPRDADQGLDDFVANQWVTLVLPGGGRLALQGGTVEHVERDQPIHLDLVADDRDTEVARATSLGAELVADWPYPDDADYTVLRDLDGHLFCIVDAELPDVAAGELGAVDVVVSSA
ncbi:putative enzyme related to lactoylglutathione lyase [Motilibacter rhizosphaerae]|uniref:Putative enzyme related to lactoylglutathione lyase n=1 Tax=Motilibacter rhizosphaerae TaxID=598652 RepID=A0A4Q7NB11_9ACTN|nr:VOC family protein [Motilibacter rhizosphaerae]RZS80065.1 putative enzyme related to lactoylglutathione lyase [Motilibacter rhizosphaerae]